MAIPQVSDQELPEEALLETLLASQEGSRLAAPSAVLLEYSAFDFQSSCADYRAANGPFLNVSAHTAKDGDFGIVIFNV